MHPIHPQFITSRDNPWVKDLRRLTQDSRAAHARGQAWLEGDHLCRALLARRRAPSVAVFAESFWSQAPKELVTAAPKTVVLSDALMAVISSLPSPAAMGFVIDLPPTSGLLPGAPTVVLDRVQDAGNVGSILRSAAAFGFMQIAALAGTALLWSPKVLRAGMGAHFALRLVEGLTPDDLTALTVPLLVTSSHNGQWLHQMALPWPCAWAFSHEGQGASAAIDARAALHVRIIQPGGEESLNVAAAAAISLHASAAAQISCYNAQLTMRE